MTAIKLIRIAAWTAVVVAAVALGATFYWQRTGSLPAPVAASIGGPFTLVDQNGNTVTEADLQGHPSAIFFGYTFCPDVCPTTLFEMTGWLADLGDDADRLKVYFVTVDPERDTRKQMAEYLQAFDPRIVGLTGTREEVDQAIAAYRVYARKVESDDGPYVMDHTATVYLLDENGRFTGTLDYQEKPETAFAKLKRLVAGA